MIFKTYIFILSAVCLLPFIDSNQAVAQGLFDNYLREGYNQLEENETETALHHFKMAYHANRLRPEVYGALAESYFQLGQLENAVEIIQEGKELFPENTGILLAEAELFVQTENTDDALQLYRELWERRDEIGMEGLSGRLENRLGLLHMQRAEVHVKNGDYNAAEQDLMSAKKLLPDVPQVYYNLSLLNRTLEKPEIALDYVEQGLEIAPDESSLLRIKGVLLAEDGQTTQARKLFGNLFDRNPEDTDSGLMYIELSLQQFYVDEAAEISGRLLEYHSGNSELYHGIRRLFQQYGAADHVLRILEIWENLHPNDDAVAYHAAEQKIFLQKFNEARISAAKLSESTEFAIKGRLLTGNSWVAEEKYAKADSAFTQFLKEYPQNADLLEAAAAVKEAREDWQAAAGLYEQAQNLNKTTGITIKAGVNHYRHGNNEKSRSLLEGVVQSFTLQPDPYYYLAYLYINESLSESCYSMEAAVSNSVQVLANLQASVLSGLEHQNNSALELHKADTGQRYKELEAMLDSGFEFMLQHCPSGGIEDLLVQLEADFPASSKISYLKGLYSFAFGSTEEALARLERAVKLSSPDEQVFRKIAEVSEKAGDLEKAVMAWERYHTLAQNSESYSGLIRVHRQMGTLPALATRFKMRLETKPVDSLLRHHTVEVLHYLQDYETARALRE